MDFFRNNNISYTVSGISKINEIGIIDNLFD